MHDKPQLRNETASRPDAPIEAMIGELVASDPAAAPDIADEIAARLDADLAAASSRRESAEVDPGTD